MNIRIQPLKRQDTEKSQKENEHTVEMTKF